MSHLHETLVVLGHTGLQLLIQRLLFRHLRLNLLIISRGRQDPVLKSSNRRISPFMWCVIWKVRQN